MSIIYNKETHWVIVSGIKRRFVLKNIVIKFFLKTVAGDKSIPLAFKHYLKVKIQKFSTTSSICYINNRCLLSGRGYSIKSKYKLSRFFLRKNYNRLLISGLRRASW